MVTTSRQNILEFLKRVQTVSAREIAHALGMTPANARYHLAILAADGRVKVLSQRRGSRGRPEKVYRLAGTLVGDNLLALSEALLKEAGQSIRVEALGKHLAGEVDVSGRPLAHRLAATVKRLNEMHYQSRWEAGSEGPRIILGHCPYAKLIERHPQLCKMDTVLLSRLMSEQLEQTAKLEVGAGERPFCVFEGSLR